MGPGGPGGPPGQVGRHGHTVSAVAALPDGRVVTGGRNGRVQVWDPADPRADPAEVGRHLRGVRAVAVLPDGRVVTGGGDDRVWLWGAQSSSPRNLLACSAYALATFPLLSGVHLFIGHARGGISCWEVHTVAQTSLELGNVRGNAMQQQA